MGRDGFFLRTPALVSHQDADVAGEGAVRSIKGNNVLARNSILNIEGASFSWWYLKEMVRA